jgi:hypothetical protein
LTLSRHNDGETLAGLGYGPNRRTGEHGAPLFLTA